MEESGKVEVIINNESKKTLEESDSFGELALLYNAPRSATIKTLTECHFWAIDRTTFKQTLEELVAREFNENRKFIEKVHFFNYMTNSQKDAIASALITQKYNKGEDIVTEGDQASSYHIIKSGVVSIVKGKNEIRKLREGDSFGEQALYVKSVRQCSVKADGEVLCLALGRDTLTEILGDKVQVITFRNIQRWAFEKSNYLSKFTSLQQMKIIENMKIENIKKSTAVYNKGDSITHIIIVIEGILKYGNEEIHKGFSFGDSNLDKESETASFDLIIENDGVIAKISLERIFKLLDGKFDLIVSRNKDVLEKELNIKKMHDDRRKVNVEFDDLRVIKELGAGQFGQVFLVKSPKVDIAFALKTISKNKVVKENLEKYLMQEKTVMETVNHPFIMQYFRSFKDENNIYFLQEYIAGEELFDAIREIGILDTDQSQFYVASMVLAVEYLHSLKIIYRDLKPENVMVDKEGYIKLIDMGTAKVLSNQGFRTSTIIGTPHYMAPEILAGKGYSFMIDVWSIGVCLYEFICGGLPFAETAEDPFDVYDDIMKRGLKFPSFMKDKKARKIISQMLNKNPEGRISGNYESLKAHQWFQNFSWEKLLIHELKPGYVPSLRKYPSKAEIEKEMEKENMVAGIVTRASGKVLKSKVFGWDENF